MLKGTVPQPKKDGKLEPWKQKYAEEYWGQRANLLPKPVPEPARFSFRQELRNNPERVLAHSTSWMEAEAAANVAREVNRKPSRKGRPANPGNKEDVRIVEPLDEPGVLAVAEAILDAPDAGRPLKVLWNEVAKDTRSRGFNQRSFSALLAREVAENPNFPLCRKANLWTLKRFCEQPLNGPSDGQLQDEPPSLEPVYRDAIPSAFSLHVRRPQEARQKVSSGSDPQLLNSRREKFKDVALPSQGLLSVP